MLQFLNHQRLVLFLLPGVVACSKPDQKKATHQPARPAPVGVQVQAVGTTTGTPYQTYSGTIEAENTASLALSVAGTVRRVLVHEGDQVHKDQLLSDRNYAPAYALLSLNVPSVHWKENRLLESQRRYQAQASRADLTEAQQQVALDVSRALLTLNQTARRIELHLLTVAQAQENLRLNENRFQVGLLSLVDLLTAQTLVQRVAFELVAAKADYCIAQASLAQAIGEQH